MVPNPAHDTPARTDLPDTWRTFAWRGQRYAPSPYTTMLLATPELGTKNHIRLSFVNALEFPVYAGIVWPVLTKITSDSFLQNRTTVLEEVTFLD
jgi:hypothetical protein